MARHGRSSPSNLGPERQLPMLLDESELQAGILLQETSRATQHPDSDSQSDSTSTSSRSSELGSAPRLRPPPLVYFPPPSIHPDCAQIRPWAQLEPTADGLPTTSEQRTQLVFLSEDSDKDGEEGNENENGAGRDNGMVPPRERAMLQKLANDPELLASLERYIDDPTRPAPVRWLSDIPVLSGAFGPVPSPGFTQPPSWGTLSACASVSSLALSVCPSEAREALPSYSASEKSVSDAYSCNSLSERSQASSPRELARAFSSSPSTIFSDGSEVDHRPVVMELSPPPSMRASIASSQTSPILPSLPASPAHQPASPVSPVSPAPRAPLDPAAYSPTALTSPALSAYSSVSAEYSLASSPRSPVDPHTQAPIQRSKRARSNISTAISLSSRSSNPEVWSANEQEHPEPRLLSRRLGAHSHRASAFKYTPFPSEYFRKSSLGYTDGNISSEDIMHSDEEALYLSSPLSALSLPKETSKATTSIVVTSAMTVGEVKIVLGDHGCTDLTDLLDPKSCSEWAISQGGFSDIYSGKLKDGTLVAIKALRLLASTEESGKQVKHAARELHTWSKCRHPNVIELLGLVDFRGRLAMVSPWMPNGSIRLYLSAYPEANRCNLCYGVSDGLAYLHELTIVHGDLKGANVLLSDQGIPKLTDFGNSALSDCSMLYTKTNSETSLSPRWTAPEIFNGGKHSYAADVFALGMTLLETITGDIPYHELEQDLAVIMAIGILKKVPKRSETHIPSKSKQGDTLWSLLTKCWSYAPEDRPTAAAIRDEIKEITSQGLRC